MTNVLFLCTGNSCRSIIAEALLNHLGAERFKGFSAGSRPAERVNPLALDALKRRGVPLGVPASKNWDVFARPCAPKMNMVLTVCDNAAGEVCPVWPGHPLAAHWGVPDPAVFEGDAKATAAHFGVVLAMLETRISALIGLDPALSGEELKRALDRIGAATDQDLAPRQ